MSLNHTLQKYYHDGVEDGRRSTALYAIACGLAEKGVSTEEIIDLVRDADSRWGKFKDRDDGIAQITLLVERACKGIPDSGTSKTDRPVHSWKEFKRVESEPIEWVLQGFLYHGALGTLIGPPGVGKTQFSIRLATSVALGRNFLCWKSGGRPQRVLYLSNEMGASELNYFISKMTDLDSVEEDLEGRLFIDAVGEAQDWLDEKEQDWIANRILDNNISGIIVDSLGSITPESLNDDKVVKALMKYADSVRRTYKVWVLFLHHIRKPPDNSKRPPSLDAMYGSTYIGGRIRTSLMLLKAEGEDNLTVSNVKQSIGRQTPEFRVKRTDLLNFEIDHSEPMPDAEIKRQNKKAAQKLVNRIISDPGTTGVNEI